jgi:excisionase family DNA binding protein
MKNQSPTLVSTYAGLQKGIPFQERPTCSIGEACFAAGFGRTKLYELIDAGTIETTKVGRRRLVRVPSLLAFLNHNASHH